MKRFIWIVLALLFTTLAHIESDKGIDLVKKPLINSDLIALTIFSLK